MIINQKNIHVLSYRLNAEGFFPNNTLPLVVYKSALDLNATSEDIKKTLKENAWENAWTGSVFTYQHYHSTAHEVLCVYKGNATLLFGGEKGIAMLLKKGDVVIIPAGVAHKNLNASEEFNCVGAYPEGQQYDVNEGTEEEYAQAIEHISMLSLPASDPVFGTTGPLLDEWKK